MGIYSSNNEHYSINDLQGAGPSTEVKGRHEDEERQHVERLKIDGADTLVVSSAHWERAVADFIHNPC